MTKICSKCGIEKSLDQFPKRKDSKDGLRTDCNECNRKQKKQYYEDNKEILIEKQRQYYEENKEIILEKQKQKYEDNREVILERNKNYSEIHKEEIKEYQQSKTPGDGKTGGCYSSPSCRLEVITGGG